MGLSLTTLKDKEGQSSNFILLVIVTKMQYNRNCQFRIVRKSFLEYKCKESRKNNSIF